MATLFKTAIEAVFDAAWLTSVDDGGTVTNGDNSASGIVVYDEAMEIDSQRLSEDRTGYVKCKFDDIGDIEPDAVVKVDGVRVWVTSTALDAAGALLRIDFMTSQPVTDELL